MPPHNVRKAAGTAVLACTILLVFLLVFIHAGSPAFNPLILAVQLLPLMLVLPGLIKRNPRTYQWLCFVDLFFLTHGILLAFTPGRLGIGLAETLICLILFVSAIIFIRASQRTGQAPSDQI